MKISLLFILYQIQSVQNSVKIINNNNCNNLYGGTASLLPEKLNKFQFLFHSSSHPNIYVTKVQLRLSKVLASFFRRSCFGTEHLSVPKAPMVLQWIMMEELLLLIVKIIEFKYSPKLELLFQNLGLKELAMVNFNILG